MGLRFDPVGGGQFKQALQQIMEVERQPIRNIEARRVREEARLKLFQEFKNKFAGIDAALNEFTNFRKFRELKVDLGDGANYFSVTLDKEKAEPGTYSIQIDELAARSSVMSNGFEDPDEPVLGIGFIVAESENGEPFEIFVDSDNASLRGVANLINKEPKSPIRASVVKDISNPDQPWKLILTGKKDGNDDRLSFPEFYFLDGIEDFYIDGENEAKNALIHFEGFPLESESNHLTDFINGVNLHLKGARPEQPFTFTISEDYQKISGKIKSLVDQVNGILEFINKQNQVDEKSDTRSSFTGDTGLQNIEYRIRNLLHEGFPVGDIDSDDFKYTFLSELGVEIGKNGLLSFKEEKFTQIMEGDFDGVAEAITGEFGFARQLKDVIAGYTRLGDGLLGLREQGLRSRIKKLDDEIYNKERRLDQRHQALTEKFSRLQASLGNLQRQQAYLSAALPGGGGGNLVSQLLGG